MEKYVVSREPAERLKAAGYPQTAEHLWQNKIAHNGRRYWRVVRDIEKDGEYEDMAAPLSDELLEQLKPIAELAEWDNDWKMLKVALCWDTIDRDWSIEWQNSSEWNPEINMMVAQNKPADALAELWLWCKENGYLEVQS